MKQLLGVKVVVEEFYVLLDGCVMGGPWGESGWDPSCMYCCIIHFLLVVVQLDCELCIMELIFIHGGLSPSLVYSIGPCASCKADAPSCRWVMVL